MALTRKMLKAMGIEDEKIDEIIDAHSETVNALKEERDGYKGEATKVEELQKALDEANQTIEKSSNDPYKVKYEAIKEEFESYKTDISKKELVTNKKNAYVELLRSAGIPDKRIESIVKITDLNGLELDDEGKVKDADKVTEGIKNEWSDFIQTQEMKGASTPNPPHSVGSKSFTIGDIRKMSSSEINANYDAIKASLKTGGN